MNDDDDENDDDDDDSLRDMSFNGIGYALQLAMLHEVTRAVWQGRRGVQEGGGEETWANAGRQVGGHGRGPEEEAW